MDINEILRQRREESERLDRAYLASIPANDAAGLLQTPEERKARLASQGMLPYHESSYTDAAVIQWLRTMRRYDAAVAHLRTVAAQGDERAARWLAEHDTGE